MSRPTLTVRFVASQAEIATALWDACFAPPLEGRWWYHALESCGLDDQFTFLYAVVECGGQPVGVAPAFVMDVDMALVVPPALAPAFGLLGKVFPPLAHQRTLFVGSPCADEGHVGLLPGVDRRAALLALQTALVAEARRLRAPMLVWKDVPDAWAADLDWLATQGKLFRLTSFPGTEVALPGRTKADYLKSLTVSHRYNLKRNVKLSAGLVEVATTVVHDPDAATLDAIMGLFWQTYDKGVTKFEKLNRRFFALVAKAPTTHFIVLREAATGDMLAFMMVFALDGHVVNKFIGLDYARPKGWRLYFRLWDALVDWAYAQGATAIQSGQTGYSAKLQLEHQLVPLTNYCQHRNRVIRAVYRAVAARVRWSTLDDDLARHCAQHPEADR